MSFLKGQSNLNSPPPGDRNHGPKEREIQRRLRVLEHAVNIGNARHNDFVAA